jgi:hypothetical protein
VEEKVEGGAARRGEREAGGLETAIRVQQARASGADCWVRVHERDERGEGSRSDLGIGVQQHEIPPLAIRERAVIRRREAQVAVALDQSNVGEAVPHPLRAAVRRGIVDDEDFVGYRVSGVGCAVERAAVGQRA